MTEADIRELIEADIERMRILSAVACLGLPDCWVGAGFVRNAVWDALFGDGTRTALNDVDVVYWKSLDAYGDREELLRKIETDEPNQVWDEEQASAAQLEHEIPGYEFEVKNQARMHLWQGNGIERIAYASATEGIADWVETATTIGVRLSKENKVELYAAYGIKDLVEGIVRPTNAALTERARERAEKKGWYTRWPALRFENAV